MFKTILISLFICQLWFVNCEEKVEAKGGISLAFVIDDTGSMGDDIDQVKTQVDSIFDAALKSNGSQIKDIILVTFNDPTTQVRTKTLDREVFKKELADINVNGGDDCPEYALTGLKQALELSRPGSIVYLFTDAGAKDHGKYEELKKLALEKNARLNFILTGTCHYREPEKAKDHEDHRVYFSLADATHGQVFSLFKKEVGQIISHARETVAAAVRRGAAPAVLFDSSLMSNSNVVKVNVAEDIKELLVTVSGPAPVVTITDPEGKTPKIEEIAKTSGATIVKVLEAKQGEYSVSVESAGPSKVVVTGINASGSSANLVE